MITLFQSDKTNKLSEIKAAMASHIKQLPAKVSAIGDCLTILRYELRCEPVDILTWLHNQKMNTKIYWSDRDGSFEIGGVRIADGLKGAGPIDHKELFEYMEDHLSSDNPRLRYYGGMNFDDSSNDSQWQEFGTYQFIIPQFELYSADKLTSFAFNIAIKEINADHIENILLTLDQLDFAAQTQYRKVPQVLARADHPNKEGWKKIFQTIEQSTAHDKIVLARKSVFDFDVALRSDALLKHLKDRTPDCYHFCFQFSTNSAFLGATPERLYKRQQQAIESEAIAGTRPRGKDQLQDREYEHQLLNSDKDAKEHKYVVDAIEGSLKPMCSNINVEEQFSLTKLKGSQHLITRIKGTLKENFDDRKIVEALHPTPAVAGCPTEDAVRTIKSLEPFNRGWYAGPVGYVGYDHAEFAVAIRCGLVCGHQLSLYAGAGIVAGSTAENEWNEIENKISNFIKVFNT